MVSPFAFLILVRQEKQAEKKHSHYHTLTEICSEAFLRQSACSDPRSGDSVHVLVLGSLQGACLLWHRG